MQQSKVPKHIGIIMDGNRRFSKKLMLKPWMGHEWGAKKIRKLFDWCRELGIREATLYTFSVENFNRPKDEFDFLMKLFEAELGDLLKSDELEKNQIRINIIGRLWMFPKSLQEKMHAIMEKTRTYDQYTANFAMAYGGRAEVVDAARKISQQIKDGTLDVAQVNEETFSKNLYFADEPDLIIRTGGEKRTSNLLIFQGAYAEWIFLDKLWPEFEKEDLIAAVEEYSKRERRFGK